MRYYPLLLDIRRAHCVVVGAGEVGQRKIETLLACDPARLTAVDPRPPGPGLLAFLARHANFTYAKRPFTDTDLDGARLVFACTPLRELNARIGLLCREKNILCNMADDPESGDFTLPASITRGDLTITVSTGGASPALSRIIRRDLEERYGPEYERLTRLMGRIRPAQLALGGSSSENRRVFRDLAAAPLPELIRKNDRNACERTLKALLPADLHPQIGEWCDDCFPSV
ncbi:MAG: bifunctional precorrin-2 dehydrogenase/sirohydrochlorin ferrochelatase [Pseudomonadota bacterium]|nr:bifunctional precorrin-2 dehydrogenase/sirohydrochlorin ferrochelatase [Pseudomonadota bacterium]